MIDRLTIDLLLCRDKNNIEVEFALPDNLKAALPRVVEIEQDLQQMQGQDEREGGE